MPPRHAKSDGPATNPFRVVAPRNGTHADDPLFDDKPRVRPRWVRGVLAVGAAVALSVFAALAVGRTEAPGPARPPDTAHVGRVPLLRPGAALAAFRVRGGAR